MKYELVYLIDKDIFKCYKNIFEFDLFEIILYLLIQFSFVL